MKSDICKLRNDIEDYKIVLGEIEKVAVMNHLPSKNKVQLLLLGEEMIGIQKALLGYSKGNFFLENTDNEYRLHLKCELNIDVMSQKTFVQLSTNRKNEAYKGFTGKLRYIIDTFTNDPTGGSMDQGGIGNCFSQAAFDRTWLYSAYLEKIKRRTADWDEMEKSILANLADEIMIGSRNNYVEMIIIKKL